MPRRPDSLDPGDILTDGVMALLGEKGADGFSLRLLAEHQGTSVGALTNRWRTRGRMLHVSVNVFRHRWNQHMADAAWADGILALLPASDDEVEDCRVWFAFCDLARTDPVVAECVADQRVQERLFSQSVLGGQPDDLALDALTSLVDGLRLALCSPEPMPVQRARAVLAHQADEHGPLNVSRTA